MEIIQSYFLIFLNLHHLSHHRFFWAISPVYHFSNIHISRHHSHLCNILSHASLHSTTTPYSTSRLATYRPHTHFSHRSSTPQHTFTHPSRSLFPFRAFCRPSTRRCRCVHQFICRCPFRWWVRSCILPRIGSRLTMWRSHFPPSLPLPTFQKISNHPPRFQLHHHATNYWPTTQYTNHRAYG